MIPDWAPNVHPLIVHFPIVYVVSAALVDVYGALRSRPAWVPSLANGLYAAGAVAALAASVSGTLAATDVLVPGRTPPLIEDHRVWALASTGFLGVVASVRLAAGVIAGLRTRPARVALVIAGLAAVVAIQQTAERGARLVYEQGVGVIGTPGGR